MKFYNIVIIAILVFQIPAYTQSNNTGQPKRYALIVGISKYKIQSFELKFADKDANDFYEFAKRRDMLNIDDSCIKKLINEEANSHAINDALNNWLDSLSGNMSRGSEIYIFWAGHGMMGFKDQKFLCHNTSVTDINTVDISACIDLSTLKSKAKHFANKEDVKIYLILDACRTSPNKNRDTDVDYIAHSSAGPGETFFYAASSNSPSYETTKLKPGNGVFTYFLLLGLKGAADTRPRDGKISFQEIYSYLNSTVCSYVGANLSGDNLHLATQNPDMSQVDPQNQDNYLIKDLSMDSVRFYKTQSDSIMTAHPTLTVPGNSRGITNTRNPVTGVSKKGCNESKIVYDYQINRYIVKTDSLAEIIFNNFLAALRKSNLVEPPNQCANYYYEKLREEYQTNKLTFQAQRMLVVALLDAVQLFFEKYIDGKLIVLKKNDFELAYKELLLSIKLRPHDDISYTTKVQLEFLQASALCSSNNPKDWNLGLAAVNQAIDSSPNASYLFQTKGNLYHNKSMYFTAIKYFDSALHYSPKWLYPLYSLGMTYYEIQEYQKSIECFQKVLATDSNYSRVYSWLGYNYETIIDRTEKQDYKRAINLNLKAISIDSANAYAYLNLGRIYGKMIDNKYQNEEISNKYLKEGALLAKCSECYTLLGKKYFTEAKYDSAQYFFLNALHENYLDTSALFNLALTKNQLGQQAEADSLFIQILKFTDYDYKFYSKYCTFLLITGRQSSADSCFKKVIEMNSQDPSIFIKFSQEYEKLGHLKKARFILQQGLERIDSSVSLNYAMAQSYFKSINCDEEGQLYADSALKYLAAVKLLSPDYSLLDYAFSQVAKLKNNKTLSEEYYNKARLNNKYIAYTKNFNNDLVAQGDENLNRKNYGGAINNYKMANQLNNEQFQTILKISRAFYLKGDLDSSYQYCNYAEKFIQLVDFEEALSDTADEIKQKELKALINFEFRTKKNYNMANNLFLEIDMYKETPTRLERAVCYYSLGKTKRAFRLIHKKNERTIEKYYSMLKLSGIYYSDYFISQLTKLASDIGPAFFK